MGWNGYFVSGQLVRGRVKYDRDVGGRYSPMIDVEETERGIRAVDAAKNEVEIELEGWEPGGEELGIERNLDSTLSGRVNGVLIPSNGVMVESTELEKREILHFGESIHLTEGEHLFQLTRGIAIYLRVNGAIAIQTRPRPGHVFFQPNSKELITLGFRSESKPLIESISVPPTPNGLSLVLTEIAGMHDVETPDRSFPVNRPHPPRLIVNEACTSEEDTSLQDRQITFRLPDSFGFLFPAAPLAFYLGAKVVVERGICPTLETESIQHVFTSDQEDFPSKVAELLYRVFYMDCLLREAGPNAIGIREYELIDDTIIDPLCVYKSSMADRLPEYLSYPFDEIEDFLPDWPLSFYLKTSADNIPAIPHLLDCLSLIYPPRSTPVSKAQLVEQSLEELYRASNNNSSGKPYSAVNLVGQEPYAGSIQGWMGDGIAVNAFNCSTEAFENERKYLPNSANQSSISVVVNEASMKAEPTIVFETYLDRAKDLSIDVEIIKNPSCCELAEIFEQSRDFVHFVGHCEHDGLVCHDGHLSTEMLSQCSVRTFFLNACNSIGVGNGLIQKGSVAGVVTLGSVLDEQAMRVGSIFAKLLMLGFTIERSLLYARKNAVLNQRYTVLGVGTHALVQGQTLLPVIYRIKTLDNDTYRIWPECPPSHLNGGFNRLFTDSMPTLFGNDIAHQVTGDFLKRLFSVIDEPVVFNERFTWPEILLEELF